MKVHDKELRLQQLLKKGSGTGLLLAEYEEYRELTINLQYGTVTNLNLAGKKSDKKIVDDWIKGGFKGNPWADCEEE